MEWRDILSHVDHTLLNPAARWEEIRRIVTRESSMDAPACASARYVKQAAQYAAGRVPICTVIGFPNGYSTAPIKATIVSCSPSRKAEPTRVKRGFR